MYVLITTTGNLKWREIKQEIVKRRDFTLNLYSCSKFFVQLVIVVVAKKISIVSGQDMQICHSLRCKQIDMSDMSVAVIVINFPKQCKSASIESPK